MISTEFLLRLTLGLGNPILVQADSHTGYRVKPNQKTVRFGNYLEYNQYSQRSEPIAQSKPPGTLRILMLGDSVLNGGYPIDQKDTISEKLKTKISTLKKPVEVLNASTGSWGIGNQLGYLEKFGTFESDLVILQIGTHDLIQSKSTSAKVGTDSSFPNKRPLLAITEGINRYIIPEIHRHFLYRPPSSPPISQHNLDQEFQQNQRYFQTMVNLIREQKIPILVVFTPDQSDVIPIPKTPPYKLNFLELTSSLEIPLIDSHQIWSNLAPQTVESYFQDHVHLTTLGNKAITDLIYQNSELLQTLVHP